MTEETGATIAPDIDIDSGRGTGRDGTGPAQAAEEADGGRPGLLALGATSALGAVLALLSTTIVAVGTGRLSEEFASPLPVVQWVSTGYLLALAVAIPAAGWAMERFGSKALWQAALVVHLVGCAAAALAPSIGVLIGARVVQGFGAAMFEPIMLTLLATAAGPKRATTVMSLVQIPITLAPVLGPVVGGLLVDHLSRPWLFWFNVPLGLLCAVAAHFVLPADPPRSERAGSRLDVTGLALLPLGLVALLLGFSRTADSGGVGSAAVWLLLVGAVAVAGYVVHALRTTGVPLIDVRLFGTGRFGASVYGAMFLLPLFFQQAGGHSTWDSGLLLALIAAIQLGGSAGTALLAVVVQQRLTDRLGAGGAGASAAASPDLAAPLTAAFGAAFRWTLGICALGAVAAFLLPGSERGGNADADAEVGA